MIADWSDYRLHESTIAELGLARENYSDALFIHPPLFVYLSAALYHYAGMSLALMPLLLQVATVLLLPVISMCVLPHRSTLDSVATALRALLLLSCCPVAALCSQKFWIDNCLMLTVTLSVVAHVWLLPMPGANSSKTTRRPQLCTIRSFASGFIFGAVGLNTKITAAALLPFAAAWIGARHISLELLNQISATTDQDKDQDGAPKTARFRLSRVIMGAAVDSTTYLVGAAAAYAPWAYLYWVSAKLIANCSAEAGDNAWMLMPFFFAVLST